MAVMGNKNYISPERRVYTESAINSNTKNELSHLNQREARSHSRKINNPQYKLGLSNFAQRYILQLYRNDLKPKGKGMLSLSTYSNDTYNKRKD